MRDAVAKLLRGDCSSIAEAAEKIWKVVEGIGMAIVNKVKDVVGAVGRFFKGIWEKYISKAWDWMATVVGSAARAVWETIKKVGEFLWDLTKPVRDIAGRVWKWLKRQIFGPDQSGGSDGKGGLLEWVKSKAEAAWDWLKEKLEPIKVPLLVIGGIVVALSPVGPVIAIGAAVVGLVKGAKWIGAKLRDRSSVIREHGYLRGVILPGIMGAVNAVWTAVSKAARFLMWIFGAAVSGLGSAVAGLKSSIFFFLSPLVGWILDLFRRIFAWASDKVGGLAGLLQSGFAKLIAFLQPLFDVVGALASVISDVLNIVKLIFIKAWHLIPACIRDPIVNFIRDQILKRIPIFSQLLEIPDIWTKVKETAFTIIRQIFKDGDIWGAAKTFFKAVLGILNIPLELVTGIFTKAWGAIDSIIRSPIRFLRSVLGAMWQGFGQFFKKILKYLLDGVLGWLTGQLKDAGIEAPTEWTFGALVKLVLSVLGVTLEKLWKLLGKKIGDPIVEKLKKAVKMLTGAWEWVAALISEGPSGLWKKLKEEVGQLKDLVIDAISGYLQATIIGEASKKILTSLNPAGAIINAIILAYNAIKTAAQYARQILEMVSKVLDAAADLAAGSVGAAANTIEWALGKALTIAIGFLANYLNLGGFGRKVADMVKKIQDRVEQAIEKIIDWAINAGRAVLNALGFGGKKEEPTVGDTPEKAALKAKALEDVRAGAKGKSFKSFDAFHAVLANVLAKYQPQGLKSLTATANPATLEISVAARASVPDRVTITWAEVFTATPPNPAELAEVLDTFQEGGQETYAALAVNGRLIGSASNAGDHAEMELMASPDWQLALDAAKAEAKGSRSDFSLLINRSPCGSRCTPNLARWLRANRASYPQVRFIIAATGNYTPPITRRQLLLQLEAYLVETGRELAVPVDSLTKDDLEDIFRGLIGGIGIRREDSTNTDNLRSLSGAGWELHQLDVGTGPTPSGGLFARRIQVVREEAAQELQRRGAVGTG
jgi:phage-related protein